LGGSNLFAYAPNPMGWVDPLGLAKKKKKSNCPDCPKNKKNVDQKLVKQVREAKGKGNDINVKTQREAEAIIEEARPEIEWNNTYQKPKTNIGKEIHPIDGSGQDLPHIKWKDWTKGKTDGAEGHIYFDGL
jgi:hypothetical protein